MANFSEWELLDDGSFNGVQKWIRSNDEDEGTVQVRYRGMDIPIIANRNRKAQNDWDGKIGEFAHAAHIPASILMQWYAEDGQKAVLHDPDYLARKLNDPDWKYLKRMPIQL